MGYIFVAINNFLATFLWQYLLVECDFRPVDGRDIVAEELVLLRNMLIAAVEERYFDAGRDYNALFDRLQFF